MRMRLGRIREKLFAVLFLSYFDHIKSHYLKLGFMDSNRKSHTRCAVCGTKDSNRNYHRIPSDQTIRRKWFEACNLPLSARDSSSAMYLYVCNLHFQKSDYFQTVNCRRKKLRKTAVPSLLLKQPCPNDSNEVEKNSSSHLQPTGLNSSNNTILTEQNSLSDTNFEEKNGSMRRYHNKCVVCGRNDNQYSYHRFPKDYEHRSKWLQACKLKEEEYLPKLRLCGEHFRDSDFFPSEGKHYSHRILRKNALPTIFAEDSRKNNYGIFCVICGFKNKGYSHHRFPKDYEKQIQWLQACNISEDKYLPRMAVCRKHFRDDDFFHSNRGENRLKSRAVPSLSLQSDEKTNSLELNMNNALMESDPEDAVANVDQNPLNSIDNVIIYDDTRILSFCEATLSTSDKLDSNEFTNNDSGEVVASANQNLSHPIGNKLLYVSERKCISLDGCEKPDLQRASNSASDHLYATDELKNITSKQRKTPHKMDTNLLDIDDSVTKMLLMDHSLENNPEIGSPASLLPDEASLNISHEVVIDENVSQISTDRCQEEGQGILKADSSIFWRYAADVGERHCQTPEEALRSVNFLKNIVFTQRKMIVSLKKALRRRDHRIEKMKRVVDVLKKNNKKKSIPRKTVEVVLVPGSF